MRVSRDGKAWGRVGRSRLGKDGRGGGIRSYKSSTNAEMLHGFIINQKSLSSCIQTSKINMDISINVKVVSYQC